MATPAIIPTSGTETRLISCPMTGALAILGSAVVMALGFGSLALTSVFMRPLEAEFGWSRSDTSFAYGVASISMALGGLFWGRLFDRVDLRILLVIGGFGMVVALLLMTTADMLWQICLANAILGGLGFSVLYAPALSASAEWFPHRRGLVTGIVTAGGAFGQGLLPFVANFLIDSFGWRAAYLHVAVTVFLSLCVFLPLIRKPSGFFISAAESVDNTLANVRAYQWRVSLLAAAAFFCCACMGIPLIHLVNFISAICASPSVGATSLLVAMVFGAIGRVFFGYFSDRTDPLFSYVAASTIQTMCVIAFPFTTDNVSLMAISAVFGFGFAGNMTCLMLCVRKVVPVDRFGGTIGAIMLVAWGGMASGSLLGGWLFDLYLDYTLVFLAGGVAGLLNLLVLLVFHRSERITRAESAHRSVVAGFLDAAAARHVALREVAGNVYPPSEFPDTRIHRPGILMTTKPALS